MREIKRIVEKQVSGLPLDLASRAHEVPNRLRKILRLLGSAADISVVTKYTDVQLKAGGKVKRGESEVNYAAIRNHIQLVQFYAAPAKGKQLIRKI